MKLFLASAVLLLSCILTPPAARAQNPVAATDPVAVDRSPNQTIWRWSVPVVLPDGRVSTRVSTWTELGSGLNYFDEATGQWTPSREEWQVFPKAIVALSGPNKVILANDLKVDGAIDLLTAEGVRLALSPVSIGLYDPVDGKQGLVAEVIHCAPARGAAPNEIVFKNCFDRIKASIRLIYRKSGLSQELLLEEPLVLPPNFSAKSRLELYSEFVAGAPVPQIQRRVLRAETDPAVRARMREPDFTDETLSYGATRLGPGKAFGVGGLAGGPRLPVGKTLATIAGRLVLIEACEFQRLQPLLGRLGAAIPPPAPNAGLAINRTRRIRTAADQAALPQNRSADASSASAAPDRSADSLSAPAARSAALQSRSARERQAWSQHLEFLLAAGDSRAPARALPLAARFSQAVLVDFETMSSSTLVCQADTTYAVTSSLGLDSLKIEGGAVLKFLAGASVQVASAIDCATSSYRAATLTSYDDNSIGESLPSSTGQPARPATSSDVPYLYFLYIGSNDLKHLHFAYADWGLFFDLGSWSNTVSHVQFTHCYGAIFGDTASCQLRNALIYDVVNAFHVFDFPVHAEHLTLNQCAQLSENPFDNTTLTFANSFLVAVTNFASNPITLDTCVTNAGNSGLFQTVGSSAHYLASGSPYRNAGTTNIDPTLLLELKAMTTYPPIVLTHTTISVQTTLAPQAQRDNDPLDIGYHFTPLDFVLGGTVVSNTTLTLLPGTAVGLCDLDTNGPWGMNFALGLRDGAQLLSEGSPANLNRFVRYNLVQEQANTNWSPSSHGISILSPLSSAGGAPRARFRFTEFSTPALASDALLFYAAVTGEATNSFTDCQFYGGILTGERPALSLTNCLFHRTYWYLDDDLSAYNHSPTLRNSLFYGGRLEIAHVGSGTWTLRDNLFDGTTISQYGDVTNSHNAYTTNVTRLTPNGAGDLLWATNAFPYQSTALGLGRFYLPTNSPWSKMTDAGSVSDSGLIGLFYHTTATNQTREASTTNNLSFHYLGLNSSGLPLDSDGDGLPDYLEDANGNGSLDSGETKTADAADWGLRVFITRPRNGSIIP